jgi:cytochrome P450
MPRWRGSYDCFRGNKDGNNEELATNCVHFWKATRAMHKKPRKMGKARKQLVQSLKPWGDNDDGAGLLQSFYTPWSALTPTEAKDNAVNALIAALDAVQALVFWTWWNLSRRRRSRTNNNSSSTTTSAWENKCRAIVRVTLYL